MSSMQFVDLVTCKAEERLALTLVAKTKSSQVSWAILWKVNDGQTVYGELTEKMRYAFSFPLAKDM